MSVQPTIRFPLLFASFFFLCSFNTDDTDYYFQLGKYPCKLHVQGMIDAPFPFISLHDNEQTAIDAYKSLKSDTKDCVLFELNHNGQRNLKFTDDHSSYLFDPNRIFTEKGIEGTLRKLNMKFDPDVAVKLHVFADTILSKVWHADKIALVALHNNTDGNPISAITFMKSGDAKEVYLSKNNDPDDFYLVTEQIDFDFFKSQDENVVLQSENAADDGSLSVYCQANKIRYINIEAQEGHLKKQQQMIKQTINHLKP